jgi:predicted transposase YdaD
MAAAPDAVQRYLEKLMMKGYEYQSEFARKYYGQGLQTGRAEGLKTGRAEGLETGRAEGLRAAVLEVARAKVADLTPEEAAAIRALHDEALLALISQLASAPGAAEARAVLHAAAMAS